MFIEVENFEFPGGQIKIKLFIEMVNRKLTGDNIEILLFIIDGRDRINRRPY